MLFSQNLKYLREINHVTQEDLAKHLKVTRSTIAGYETRGKQPDYEKLIKIAAYFHVSTDYLLKGTSDNTDTFSVEPADIQQRSTLLRRYQKLSNDSQIKVLEYMDLLSLKDHRDAKKNQTK